LDHVIFFVEGFVTAASLDTLPWSTKTL